MLLEFSYHPPGLVPAPSLILEIVVPDDGLPGWPARRPLQQVLNLPLQNIIAGEPDGIKESLLLQVCINLRAGKGSIRLK